MALSGQLDIKITPEADIDMVVRWPREATKDDGENIALTIWALSTGHLLDTFREAVELQGKHSGNTVLAGFILAHLDRLVANPPTGKGVEQPLVRPTRAFPRD